MQYQIMLCSAIALGIPGVTTSARLQKEWKVGTPIVTYWAGPAMTDAAAQQLKDGGWNLVWCNEKELDVATRHGLRAQLTDPLLTPTTLDDPSKLSALEALVARVRKHKALYCYFLTDEPDAGRFAGLGRLVSTLKRLDPDHMAYINLFPTYATNEQLGTKGDTVTAYKEHLRRYVEEVNPSLISYDHYQFAVKGDMPDYFLNLALIRRAAMDAGVPFMNIVQACTWTPSMREPTEGEMRYLVHTTLAYGATAISYYVYSYPGHSPGIATLDGKPTHVYDWLSRLNPEFVAVVSQLQKLSSIGVYHAGMLPPGAESLLAESPFTLDPPVAAQEFKTGERTTGILLGLFGKKDAAASDASHVYVVNLDYKESAEVRIRGVKELETFDPVSRKWSSSRATSAALTLAPGGGRLVRVKR